MLKHIGWIMKIKIQITSINFRGVMTYLLGISAYYHDSAAALIKNGKIIAAAQEERFTRIKQDSNFPINAINYCLEEAGITPEMLDGVVYYEKPFVKFERILETAMAYVPNSMKSFINAMPVWLNTKLFIPSQIDKYFENIRKEIMDLLSRIIAAVDFPEDVVEPEYSYIEDTIEGIIEKINYILSFSKSSNVFRQGIKIVLAGRPNVGKSSLFNTLLNLDRAIVTDIAGTTRDVIQETLDIDGIAVTIIDTAGIRDDENINKVEAIGIDYSKKYVQDADLVLFLYDLNDGFTKEDKEILDSIKDKKYIKVATKSDLTSFKDDDSVCISLKTGENIEVLKQKIKSAVITQNLTEVEFITNQRQQKALEETKNSLINALIAAQNNEIQDLISIDIKSALMYISEVSGEVITDDILNNIFDNFCIGK